ncbi:MAG: hypothetical protein PHP06_06630 [Clostridia bacterium]|nr:hypothetical protein [Clostridia bacterium]
MGRKKLITITTALLILLTIFNTNAGAQPESECSLEVKPQLISVLGDQTVNFEITVKNTGKTDLQNVAVSEGKNAIPGASFEVLKPGEVKTVLYSKQVRPGNVYSFTVVFNDGNTQTQKIEVKQSIPGVELVREIKKQDGTVLPDSGKFSVMAGENIQIKYTITNTGDADLEKLVVKDQGVGFTWDKGILKIGQSDSKVVNKKVNQGIKSNPRVFFGGDVLAEQPSITISPVKPGLEIAVKPTEVKASKGEQVDFEITVNNTGSTTIDNVAIYENTLGKIIDVGSIMAGGHVKKIRKIQVENSAQYTFMAKGTDKFSGQSIETAGKSVKVTIIQPKLQIALKADPGYIQKGDEVIYSYVVKNAGNTNISNIAVIDSIFGQVATIDILKPGEERTITKSITLEGTTQNDAFVDGIDSSGNRVSAQSELVTVEVEAAETDELDEDELLDPDIVIGDTDEKEEEELQTGTDFLFTLDNALLIIAVIAFLGSGIGLIYMIATGIRGVKVKTRR